MGRVRNPIDAAYALPAAFTALLILGAAAAAASGGLGPTAVLVLAAAITTSVAAVSTLPAAPLVAGMSWLTTASFSFAPYGQLEAHGRHALLALVVIADAAAVGALLGLPHDGCNALEG